AEARWAGPGESSPRLRLLRLQLLPRAPTTSNRHKRTVRHSPGLTSRATDGRAHSSTPRETLESAEWRRQPPAGLRPLPRRSGGILRSRQDPRPYQEPSLHGISDSRALLPSLIWIRGE